MTLDEKNFTKVEDRNFKPETKPDIKEIKDKFDYKPKPKKIKYELTLNDDMIFIHREGRTDMVNCVPAPFERDGQAWIPLETLFEIFNKEELKRDGNKITIERSL